MYNAFISYSHAADGRMAPALQLALEKFAKPWYKVRNLDVFRDEASLSVSPHLWLNIQQALDRSEYLIYMASPVSAASKWVNKEVEYWVANKPLEKLLIVLTEGGMPWDDKSKSFLDAANNSLPDILDKKFSEKPFYIDLRSLKTAEDLSLNNPIFKKEVLKLAAHLHGKAPKDMASDEVLAHQKMLRVRNAAIGLLTLLFVTALGAAVVANKNANEALRQTNIARDSSIVAQQQRGIAIRQTKIAEDSAREARRQRDNAFIQEQIAIEERNNAVLQKQIAVKERNIAQANFLISEAQRETNPTHALLFAKEALKTHPAPEIYNKAYAIYRENNFYKTIISNMNIGIDSIAFLPGDNSFITYGLIDDLAAEYDIPVARPYYIKNGKKIFAAGKTYRVWNLSGELLDELTAAEVSVLYGHPFKKPLQTIFVQYDDSRLWIEDKQGEIIKSWETGLPGKKIVNTSLSADQSKIISYWNDGFIRIWDITSGIMIPYKLPGDRMIGADIDCAIAISGDGKKMITSVGNIRLWNIEDKNICQSVLLNGTFEDASFSADNKNIILTSGEDSRQWTLADNKILAFKNNSVPGIVKNNTDLKIGGDFDQFIMRGKKENEQYLVAISDGIAAFGILPGNKFIVTSSVTDDTLRLWNVQSSHPELYRFNKPIRKILNDGNVTISEFHFSGDGRMMLTSSPENEMIRLWDLTTGSCMMVFPQIDFVGEDGRMFMCFSSDNKKIFIARGQLLTVWNCPDYINDYFKKGKVSSLQRERNSEKFFIIHD